MAVGWAKWVWTFNPSAGRSKTRRQHKSKAGYRYGFGEFVGAVYARILQNGWPSETKRYAHGAKVLAKEGRRSPACKGFLNSFSGAQIKLTQHGYVVASMVS